MKTIKISILLLFSLSMFSCKNNEKKETEQPKLSTDLVNIPKSADAPSDKLAVIQFNKTECDFGKILQGEVVSYTFHFTNTGNVPLLISSVEKSCGCTASDFPREPIAPGETGDIKSPTTAMDNSVFSRKR